MTIAVDVDVMNQTKPKDQQGYAQCSLILMILIFIYCNVQAKFTLGILILFSATSLTYLPKCRMINLAEILYLPVMHFIVSCLSLFMPFAAMLIYLRRYTRNVL